MSGRIYSQVCLVVALVFVFTLISVALPKPVRATTVEPLTSEAANGSGNTIAPEASPSVSEEAEPSEEILPSEEPSPSVEPSEELKPSEDIEEERIELEFPEIPEAVIGEYLVPITNEEYEALLAAQPKLTEAEEAAELEKYVHTVANVDGSFTKQIFFEPVRYQDEDGVWQDIDTSLIQSKVDSSLVQSAAGELDMSFATSAKDGLETTIKKDDYQITFKLLPVDELTTKEELNNIDVSKVFSGTETVLIEQEENLQTQKVETKEVKLQTAKEDLQLGTQKSEAILEEGAFTKKVGDEIITKEVTEQEPEVATNFTALKHKGVLASSIDMKMTPTSTGLKEEIILNAPTYIDRFTYLLNLTELYPILLEGGSVVLLDKETNEVVAYIPLPFMYDSAEELNESYDIEVNIQKLSDTEYLYQLIPNQEWLQAEDRVYPVTIDPQYNFNGSSHVHDTHVSTGKAGTILFGDPHLRIGRDSAGSVYRSFIYLNPTVIGDAYITSASLDLYENYGGASTINAELYVSPSAPFNSMTWNNSPKTMESHIANRTISGGAKWYTWDISNQVRQKYSENRGIHFMVKSDQEGVNRFKRFNSCTASSLRPTIVINCIYPPSAPGSVLFVNKEQGGYINMNAWFYNMPQIHWGRSNPGAGGYVSGYQYATTTTTTAPANGAYANVGTDVGPSHYAAVDIDVPDGYRYLWIRAYTYINGTYLYGPPTRSEMYHRDRTAPVMGTFTAAEYRPATNSIYASWNLATDIGGSGIRNYYAHLYKEGVLYRSEYRTAAQNHVEFTNIEDNHNYDVRVIAYDCVPNASGAKISGVIPVGDVHPPSAPSSVSIDPSGWTNNTTPTLSWSGIQDANLLKAQYKFNNASTWINIAPEVGTVSGSIEIDTSELSDGTHTIYVRGVDEGGREGEAHSVQYYKATQIPASILSVADKTIDTATFAGSITTSVPIASWKLVYGYGTEQPVESLLTIAEQEVNGSQTSVIINHTWDTTIISKNKLYSVFLIGYDVAGNMGISERVSFMRTPTGIELAAGLQINSPTGRIVNKITPFVFDYIEEELQNSPILNPKLIVNGNVVASGEGESNSLDFDATEKLAGSTTENPLWKYPEGEMSFFYVQGKDVEGNDIYSSSIYDATIIDSNFQTAIDPDMFDKSTGVYIFSNRGAYGAPGYIESKNITLAGNIKAIDIYTEEDFVASGNLSYQYSLNNGETWQDIPTMGTGTSGIVEKQGKIILPIGGTGTTVKIKVNLVRGVALKSMQVTARHTAYTNAVLIDNSFATNARGFTALNNTWHEADKGAITLYNATTGSVDSTMRTVSTDVEEAVLVVDEVKPEGTDITYQISTDGGETFEDITPGDYNTPEDWKVLANNGRNVVLRANLSSNALGETPELKGWTLGIMVNTVGQPHVVQLVEEPTNLSTLTNANYGTLLRWKPSEEEVTYNLYRSDTPYFQPSEETLLASGITEANYTDMNLNYGKTFWYQVTAVKMIDGYPRESVPSNQAWATVADKVEVEKRLGLQDYWSFAGFSTGSGEGYVNVNNGNLVYSTTDMVVSDPFFASVMRRTYNSMATTKTPMGYGWDFSFNTTLMREFDETGTTEVGMILKDGDGSFHRFPLNSEGGYDPAKGTFMTFAYDDVEDQYTILRKDNVKYHFDGQSFKLKKFSNPNGNELRFSYDDRGNLCEITNTVGDSVYIEYYVQRLNTTTGAFEFIDANEVKPEDYIYVNDHVDMVKNVRWEGSDETAVLEYTYTYDENDRLTRSSILNENNSAFEEEFTYDAEGNMVSISNAMDQAVTLTYDADGRTQKVDTPMEGVYSTFNYEAPSVTIMGALSSALGGQAATQSYTTVEDENGVGVQYITNEDGCLVQKIDALGHAVYYAYNDKLQVTSMSYYNQVEGVNQYLTNSYTYDANGNITRIQGPAGAETVYEGYNSFNLPARVKVKNNGRFVTTSYTYDGNGNLLTTTDPTGKVMRNTYGTRNRNYGYLLSQTDRLGKVTSYAYDTKGRVTSVSESGGGQNRTTVQYTYDAYGRTATQTDAANRTTQLTYNKFGLLVGTEYPDGTTESVQYDLMGKVQKTTNAKGQETRYSYDGLNRPIGVVYPDGSINTTSYQKWDSDGNGTSESDKVVATDGEGRTSTVYYDKAGRTIKQEGGGATVRYEFDNIGNMIKQTQVGGNAGGVTVADRVATAKYNALGQMTSQTVQVGSSPNATNDITTRFTYDILGNQLSATDALGNTTNYTYDDLNRLTRVSQTVGGTQLHTDYAYDVVEGNYIRNSVTDANGHRDDTLFDLLGNKVMDRTTGMQTNYAYNIDGSVNIVTRNDNTKVRYAYDNMGRVSSVNYYEANQDEQGASGHYLTFTYDELGNGLTESVFKGGVEERTTYVYDEMSRVQQYTQGMGGNGLDISYTYNHAGQITSTSYHKSDNQTNGNGEGHGYQVTTYGYDHHGRNANIYAGTADTLFGAETSKQLVREYTYNSVNEIVQTKDYPDFTRNHGTSTSGASYTLTKYVYDSIGRMTTKTYEDHINGAASGVVKESHTLTYDKNGNILSEVLGNNYDEAKTINKSYVFDAVGRLTNATEDNKITTYTYDNVGNRTSMTEDSKTYSYVYNALDQLTSISEGGSVKSTYTYDARGNQTQEVSEHFKVTINGTERIDNKVTDHSYDLLNQLTASTVTTPKVDEVTGDRLTDEVNTASNSYDAQGKRIKRVETINGVEETSRFYYMGSAVLYTSDEYNVLQTENILDLAGTTIMSYRFLWPYQAQENQFANQWYTYRYDVRGSVTNITNPEGTIVDGYEYNEFGVTQQVENQGFRNELTFTGSVKDTSTGLQYMNARFYEPQTGRFLSQDTYTGNAYDPWTQHLYAYCANNPVNFIDPTGHEYISVDDLNEAAKKYKAAYNEMGALGFNSTDNVDAGLLSPLAVQGVNALRAIKGMPPLKYAKTNAAKPSTIPENPDAKYKAPYTEQDIIEHYTSIDMYGSYEMQMDLYGLSEQKMNAYHDPNYWHPAAQKRGMFLVCWGVKIADFIWSVIDFRKSLYETSMWIVFATTYAEWVTEDLLLPQQLTLSGMADFLIDTYEFDWVPESEIDDWVYPTWP